MPWPRLSAAHLPLAALLCLAAAVQAPCQNPQPPQNDQTEVVRITTELVQTDVTVLDRDGRFVEGLKPEQFELRVDGKLMPISFFERVAAGAANEEAQLAAARGGSRAAATDGGGGNVKPLDRGRTFFFFVDDLHQSPESMKQSQKILLDFIENRMGQNDRAAIASPSGQVGFLQQLTDNKAVLRAAVARLKLPQRTTRDSQRPPMTESMALAIEVRHDQDVLDFFANALVQEGLPRESAESMVKARAQQILQQSYYITHNTLRALEALASSSASLPGRKVVFFLSDGFLLDMTETVTSERLRNITNLAALHQVVIYTVDARGLAVSEMNRASDNMAFDPSGRLSAFVMSDVSTSQEPLRVIASNTGGRALLNSNDPSAGVTRAVQETSSYYLLAWRPEGETQRGKKFRRIEVKVVGRPELSVQVRGGFYDNPPAAASKEGAKPATPKASSPKSAEDALRQAIKSMYPSRALPTRLDLAFLDLPEKGLMLSASAQIESQFLSFDLADGKHKGGVDIAGIVFDAQGKPSGSFKDHLDVVVTSTDPAALAERPIVYTFPFQLAPGLYQVRIATRDSVSGRMGGEWGWIEIPDLSSRVLSMSSLILGETSKEAEQSRTESADLARSRRNVDHRFDRSSSLRFITFIYNAGRGAGGAESPDVAVQIQVLRDDQPVITAPVRKVQYDGKSDLTRIPYGADIPLGEMVPGRYVLKVTVIDRIAKTSSTQSATFDVE